MKIAVTYENGEVFQHFGHCEHFKIFETEGKSVQSESTVSAEGEGHGALAGFLKDRNVEVLICGGIGGGAREALSEAGIRVYPGVTGNADQAVRDLLEGTLAYNPDEMCSHHHDGPCGSGNPEGGQCGNGCHDDGPCGEEKHGCRGNL